MKRSRVVTLVLAGVLSATIALTLPTPAIADDAAAVTSRPEAPGRTAAPRL